MPNVRQSCSLKTRKDGAEDLSTELGKRICLLYRSWDLCILFQAAPGRRKLILFGTFFFNLQVSHVDSQCQLIRCLKDHSILIQYLKSLSFSVLSVISYFVIRTGFWSLELSIKQSLVYPILNSILTEGFPVYCASTCPAPQPFFSPLFRPALASHISRPELSCFQLYQESKCEVLPEIRAWGREKSDNLQPSFPFLSLAQVLKFSAFLSCHSSCPVLQNYSRLHRSAGPQQMLPLPSCFPLVVLRTDRCGYIPWCFPSRPFLHSWPSCDSINSPFL